MLTNRRSCPECGSNQAVVIRRKMLVTELRRCLRCELLFRAPIDPPNFEKSFYQNEYRSGFTTDCPSDQELDQWKQTSFRGTEKDFSTRIALLKAIHAIPGQSRILDFGCSWGYGTWQLKEAGYEIVGTEISTPRARYAREKMHLDVVESVDETTGRFDVFFSTHVIEHLSRPRIAVDAALRLLGLGGLFVAFTPNGCRESMDHNPSRYHRSWGGVHPSYLDDRYWRQAFPNCACLAATSPYDLEGIADWNQKENRRLSLRGPELLFIAKLPD